MLHVPKRPKPPRIREFDRLTYRMGSVVVGERYVGLMTCGHPVIFPVCQESAKALLMGTVTYCLTCTQGIEP